MYENRRCSPDPALAGQCAASAQAPSRSIGINVDDAFGTAPAAVLRATSAVTDSALTTCSDAFDGGRPSSPAFAARGPGSPLQSRNARQRRDGDGRPRAPCCQTEVIRSHGPSFDRRGLDVTAVHNPSACRGGARRRFYSMFPPAHGILIKMAVGDPAGPLGRGKTNR